MEEEELVGLLGHLHPSRFLSFSFPKPLPPPPPPTSSSSSYDPFDHHAGDSLRVAVLDSPIPTHPPGPTAAMLVPRGRESDWIFSTVNGHLQLLLLGISSSSSSAGGGQLSRLILVGNPPPPDDSPPSVYTRPGSDDDERCGHRFGMPQFERCLRPLLLALCPRSAFQGGALPQVPFLSFEDDVVRIVLVERVAGPVAGEMLVEDVDIVIDTAAAANANDVTVVAREFRRRLRFKRMPYLVQSQILLVPDDSGDGAHPGGFRLQTGVLIQTYLAPMVAALSLAGPSLEERTRRPGGSSSRPRVLCLGVGGGALLTFLESQMGFDVLGVEADEAVLSVARRHFGLTEGEFLHVRVGDGIGLLESFNRQQEMIRPNSGDDDSCSRRVCGETGDVELGLWQARLDGGVHAIMVDLDSGDVRSGAMAPPPEFARRTVLLGAIAALSREGILVINVIPLKGSLYDSLVSALREVFPELYQISVGNEENCVLVAKASTGGLVARDSPLCRRLKQTVGEDYMDGIRKF